MSCRFVSRRVREPRIRVLILEKHNKGRSTIDIEHVPVPDDPRAWSYARKTLTLAIVSSASMIASIATTVQNPANAQIEQSLHASGSEVSWSISAFIIVQGLFPLVWSAIGEIKGRKIAYLLSMSLFILGSAVVATSNSIALVIAMRTIQGAGSSAVMTIAAATLADMYDSCERGTKMGIYYSAPLLGSSMGPFLGGVFAQAWGWRAVFYLTLIFGGIVLLFLFIFFKDSFRKERSFAYQHIPHKRLEQPSPVKQTTEGVELGLTADSLRIEDIKLSFSDVNPFPPMVVVLKRWNNNAVLLASGLIFGFTSSLAYTCARTLSTWYGYNALHTGLVLLSYGVGSVCGSVFGGRWSDRMLIKLQNEHGQKIHAELRLQSTWPAMPLLPLSAVGYAWTCQTHQPIVAICVMLFISGISTAWMYTCTLAYIIDANVGRSSTAAAVNSVYRGILAFIAIEIAIPLQNSIGDGGLYTFWAGLLAIVDILILLVFKFGKQWRERCEEGDETSDG